MKETEYKFHKVHKEFKLKNTRLILKKCLKKSKFIVKADHGEILPTCTRGVLGACLPDEHDPLSQEKS